MFDCHQLITINPCRVHCKTDKNKAIAQKFGIRGFPTLKIFAGTNPPQDYNGERSSDAMYV